VFLFSFLFLFFGTILLSPGPSENVSGFDNPEAYPGPCFLRWWDPWLTSCTMTLTILGGLFFPVTIRLPFHWRWRRGCVFRNVPLSPSLFSVLCGLTFPCHLFPPDGTNEVFWASPCCGVQDKSPFQPGKNASHKGIPPSVPPYGHESDCPLWGNPPFSLS